MEELQQEAEHEIAEEEEEADQKERDAAALAREGKEKALATRVEKARKAKHAADRAAEKAGEVEEEPTGKASRYSSARKLTKLFLHGAPSNDLEKAGLIIHCFDDTENWGQKWMPSAMDRGQILANCAHPPRVLKTSPIAQLLDKECDYVFDEDAETKVASRMGMKRLRDALETVGVLENDGNTWDKAKLVSQLIKAKRANAKAVLAEHRAAKRLNHRSDGNISDAKLVPARGFWSTSVINYDVRTTFGRSGVILSADHNEVQCAFPADMGTMDSGCNVSAMRMDLAGAIQASRWGGYNEVLVSTEAYLDNLPRSLAAFVYGLRGSETEDVAGDNAGETAGTYLAFLDFYNLTQADVPLLRVEYDVPFDTYAPDMYPNATTAPGAVFTDVSHSAHNLAANYRRRLSKRESSRREEPKLWLGEGHAFREGAQKLDKQHEQQIKRQMQKQNAKVSPSEAELRNELEAEMKERDILRAELKSEKQKAKMLP